MEQFKKAIPWIIASFVLTGLSIYLHFNQYSPWLVKPLALVTFLVICKVFDMDPTSRPMFWRIKKEAPKT